MDIYSWPSIVYSPTSINILLCKNVCFIGFISLNFIIWIINIESVCLSLWYCFINFGYYYSLYRKENRYAGSKLEFSILLSFFLSLSASLSLSFFFLFGLALFFLCLSLSLFLPFLCCHHLVRREH